MALKDTMHKLKVILHDLAKDLEKAFEGNKTAAQRVRTGSVHFAKAAKVYRKESMQHEKKGGSKKAKKVAVRKK